MSETANQTSRRQGCGSRVGTPGGAWGGPWRRRLFPRQSMTRCRQAMGTPHIRVGRQAGRSARLGVGVPVVEGSLER